MRMRTTVAALVACLAVAPACHKSSSISAEQRVRSDNLTAAAVASLLSGAEDFAALQGQLAEAVAINRDSVSAKLFLGVVTLLAKVHDEIQADGQLNQLLQRAGFVQTGTPGSLWAFELQTENHGQGTFKDTTPTLGEIQAWVHGTVRPALANLLTVLDAIPANWEYVIPAANGGLLLPIVAPGQQFDLRLDHGDVQLAAAVGHGLQSLFDLLRVVDWDDLAPNAFDPVDHPDLDVLEVIRTTYPDLGRLANVGDLLVARDRLKKAWQAYEKASAHLRGENAEQQAQGLITLGRSTFGSQQEAQQFLAFEARVRAFVGPTIDKFWQDVIVRFDSDLLTGAALPLADQVEINCFRFFQGLDLRETYFKTVLDPFGDKREFGVGSLAELTPAMATFGEVLVRVGGATPGAGDLQELLYGVRIEAPPQSTKTIDGSFADWATGAVQALAPPTAWIDHPSPDLGSLLVAVDANNLYVWQNRDLLPSLIGLGDTFEILVTGPSGEAGVQYDSSLGVTGWSSYGETPVFVANAQGLEIRFPLGPGSGQFVRLERQVHADNTVYVFDSDPEPVFVKVH